MVGYDLLFDKRIFEKEIHGTHAIAGSQLGLRTLKDALVLPCRDLENGKSGGGIVEADGSFLMESTVHYGSHVPYQVEEDQVTHSDETVIFFGMLVGVWGHCFTDCIKRAWFFSSAQYKERFSDVRIVYIAHKGSLHQNFIELLYMLDIRISSFTEITKPTRFKEVIVPDSSFFTAPDKVTHFTPEYKECIDRIKAPYKKEETEIDLKIYYSHRNVRGYKNDIGEERIEAYLKQNGFQIVHPERLRFSEQLELLSRCSVFAATDGSTSHNSIFLPEHSSVMIIPRSPYLTFHQLALNELYPRRE